MAEIVYAFCNLVHTPAQEHSIRNHPILAMNYEGKEVAHWICTNHSFGRMDIDHAVRRDYSTDVVIEWVEDPPNHPIVSKLLNKP